MKTLHLGLMHLQPEYIERTHKWLNYTISLKDSLGIDEFLFIDNASDPEIVKSFESYPIKIIRAEPRLDRPSVYEYAYWYRAFEIGYKYAQANGFDKVIHLDTDAYVISPRVCDYIKNISTGWMAFNSKKYGFPEAAMTIVCSDKLQVAIDFMSEGYKSKYGLDAAENIIPWTHVEKSFRGDRYGETTLIQESGWDYVTQVPTDMKITYNK